MSEFNYHFEDRRQYYENLADDIAAAQAGDIITIATMSLDTREPLVKTIMEELGAAALRDVDVAIAVDAFTFLENDGFRAGPLWFPGKLELSKLHQPYRSFLASLEEIKNCGGRYRITNLPGRPLALPFAGRSHIKGAVIRFNGGPQPVIRSRFGGHNLNTADELDIMAVSDNPELADRLETLIRGYIDDGNVRRYLGGQDQRFRISRKVEMLVDAGVPSQSVIHDEALKFIDKTDDWLFLTCQYFPGGVLGHHLKRAQQERGVRIQLAFSPPGAHRRELQPGHVVHNLIERLRLPKNFFDFQLDEDQPLLHAKLLANKRGAMLGTHNYVEQGVRLGTAELAFLVDDPAFSLAAIEAIAKQLPFEIYTGQDAKK